MKTLFRLCCLGALAWLCPAEASAALSPPRNILGKFLASSVNGSVTCGSEGRIFDLTKSQVVTARGAWLQTGPKANTIIVFSNGTGVYIDENTRIEIVKFDQEFFAPNNNLRVEPSNSATVVRVKTGRVVISTPRLLSGTTMYYETPHAAVGIRGDKVLIETEEKQTHVAMLAGNATVNPRDAEGRFVSIGKRLVTGQEAFVKYTVAGTAEEAAATTETAATSTPTPSVATAEPAVVAPPPPSERAEQKSPPPPRLATIEVEATLLQVTGDAQIKLPGARAEAVAKAGDKLPRGARLTTADSSEVLLQVFPGTLAQLRPASILELSSLSTTSDKGVVTKESTLLYLSSGSLVSTIDPAKGSVNDYAVRTPQGIARAKGTSFLTRVRSDGAYVATTADVVTFEGKNGSNHRIPAGQVSVATGTGELQPPVALVVAAADAAFAADLRGAFESVAAQIQHPGSGLPPASATNIFAKVASSTAAALPSEAPTIVSRAVSAVTAPSSATSSHAAEAAAAVTQATVAATPAQAANIAVAALNAAQSLDTTLGAAAAKGSPSQAALIAGAVSGALLESDAEQPTRAESIAAVAAAITACGPKQAAPVAVASMQSLMDAVPNATPALLAERASLIAATVTAAAPDQAVPVATAMMKLLLPKLSDATPHVVAQTGSVLAGGIITVVPAQAQEVATAVMQLIVQAHPAAGPTWITDTAGLIASALVQRLPAVADRVIAGIAAGAQLSIAAVQQAAGTHAPTTAAWTAQIASVYDLGNRASERAANGARVVSAGYRLAQAGSAPVNPGFSGFTSVANGGTSMVIGSNAETNSATSIVITQFNPGLIEQLTADIEAAQAAQHSVQFSIETTPNRGANLRVDPVVPKELPSEHVVSLAR